MANWILAGLLAIAALGGHAAETLTGAADDYDGLLAMIGDARVVMLGESTHGSREFQRERARLTRRLIEEKGFAAVVLEAPWEPVRRLDAYIGGAGRDADASAAFGGFVRFPRWMWRNVEFRDFVAELRAINAARAPGAAPVRLYGMDLYSVPESADVVVRHVARRSVAAAALARQRYACFDRYMKEPQDYGREVTAGRAPSCADGAAAQLADMAADSADEDDFAAWQSARVVKNGEDYYRAMYRTDVSSWNLRERHMADTLVQVTERLGPGAKIIVWAQNVHQGDARETAQAAVGELSLGQLMRERYGADAVLIGMTTYRGRVRAAAEWGAPDRVWRLRPALRRSWSGQLHATGLPALILRFRDDAAAAAAFSAPRIDRVVGVTYLPHDELRSHYFDMRLSRQFDAVIHIDVTNAVEPMPK